MGFSFSTLRLPGAKPGQGFPGGGLPTGKPKAAKKIDSWFNFPTPKILLNQGTEEYGAGQDLTAEGVGGIRSLDQGYTDRLATGAVLPDSVYQAYNSLRGEVRDTAARDTTALGVGLGQRNAQSGGRLSPEQMAELQKQGEEGINNQEFASLRGVGQSQAEAELTQTNNLMDRIEKARSAILNAGQFQTQLGQQAQIAAMLAALDRRKAIAGTVTSLVSSLAGGR